MPALRLAIDVDPDTLDPAGQTNPTIASIVDHMAETLVRLQPDGSVGPGLARKFTSRPTGAAIPSSCARTSSSTTAHCSMPKRSKLSLQRFLNPQLRVPLRAPFDTNLVDEHRADRPADTPHHAQGHLAAVPAEAGRDRAGDRLTAHARTFPDSFNEEPVGTGPYRFKERRKGESVVLERFDRYWGKQPHYPLVQFRIVPEVATRESLLLANQVELILQPPLSDLPALQKNPNLKVLLTPTARSTFVAMDLTLPGGTPLAIKKVRQALNYAIDRDGIIRNVLFGAATPLDAPMALDAGRLLAHRRLCLRSQSRPGSCCSRVARPTRSCASATRPVARCRRRMAAQLAQALAGNLRDAGVDTELIGSDWPSFLAAISVPEDKGTAHMHLFNWAPAMLDASQQMTQFVRCAVAAAGPGDQPLLEPEGRAAGRARPPASATISGAWTSTPRPSASSGTTRPGSSCGRRPLSWSIRPGSRASPPSPPKSTGRRTPSRPSWSQSHGRLTTPCCTTSSVGWLRRSRPCWACQWWSS